MYHILVLVHAHQHQQLWPEKGSRSIQHPPNFYPPLRHAPTHQNTGELTIPPPTYPSRCPPHLSIPPVTHPSILSFSRPLTSILTYLYRHYSPSYLISTCHQPFTRSSIHQSPSHTYIHLAIYSSVYPFTSFFIWPSHPSNQPSV